jgi:hypothetical protein
MKNMGFSVRLIAVASFAALANAASDPLPLTKLQLELKARMLNSRAISYELTNNGPQPVIVGMMSCSLMDSWSTDTPYAKLQWPGFHGCDKNFCKGHKILPKKSLKGALSYDEPAVAGKRMPFRIVLKTCSTQSTTESDIGTIELKSNAM